MRRFSRSVLRLFEISFSTPHDQLMDGLFSENTVDIDVNGNPAHMTPLGPEYIGHPPGSTITGYMTHSVQAIAWENDELLMNHYEFRVERRLRRVFRNYRRQVDFQHVIELYQQSRLIPLVKGKHKL